MRFAAGLAVGTSVISFTAILFVLSGSGQAEQQCPANASTCAQLSACAPFKNKDDLKYRKWLNCAAYGNPDGPSTTDWKLNKGGLPFQSPIPTPSR